MSSSLKKRKQAIATIEDKEQSFSNGRLLSCQRCRTRKIKCNFECPCSNCIKLGANCIKTTNDMRKKRPPANYVSSLERQVANLRGFFEKFKKLESVEQKQKLIESSDLNDMLVADEHEYATDTISGAEYVHEVPMEDVDSSNRSVYGPISVYDNDLISKNPSLKLKKEESSINNMNKDPHILHCLKLFFTWQYPDHNMFIFREAFLIDFFSPNANMLYCSRALVLSICALGSRMSDSDKIYSRSIHFYNEARSLLLSQLEHPSISSLQSFFLLAFYDICNGSNSSGWMLSGNAMRMGFDLGFQLNPKVWFLKSHDDLSPLDVAIRSRIYWGTYMADHFISLLLGRPSCLKMSDASIPETDDLPDLEWIDEYRYLDPKDKNQTKKKTHISNPLKNVINLINISDDMLNDIFTKIDHDHDKNSDDLNLMSRLEKLSAYNTQIIEWKDSLPSDLAWDRESLQETADNPTKLCIRYYYYILMLCLNRPFVVISKSEAKDNHLSPAVICKDAIEDLYVAIHKFKETHGLRRASIFIVYCTILSISVILLGNTSKQLIDLEKERLQFFMQVLQDCSKTWKLAEKSYKLIQIKLQYSYGNELDIHGDIFKTASNKASTGRFESKTSSSLSNVQTNVIRGKPKESVDRREYQSSTQPETSPSITPSDFFPGIPQGDSPSKDVSTSLTHEISAIKTIPNSTDKHHNDHNDRIISDINTELLFDENLEFFGGPPVLMTSDLFNEDWESLFPDYIFNPKT